MQKIRKLVENPHVYRLIDEIVELLEKHKKKLEKETRRKTFTRSNDTTIDDTSNSNTFRFDRPKISSSNNNTNVIDLTVLDEALDAIIESDYVKYWSKPNHEDCDLMNELKKSLKSSTGEDNLMHTLSYIKTAIRDYSPELFLQPPYIYSTILQLTTANGEVVREVINVLKMLTIAIRNKCKSRKLSMVYLPQIDDKSGALHSQISIVKFSYDLLKAIFDNLKVIDVANQREYFPITFKLASEIIHLLEIDGTKREYFFEICNDLGYMARYYRKCGQDSKNRDCLSRINYLVVMELIARLSKLIKISETLNISESVWMSELKIICYDLVVQEFYPKLYAKVMEVVEPNDERNLMLQSNNVLSVSIEILREPFKISEDGLIMRGLDVIKTLHITKSIDLVSYLINAISNKDIYTSDDVTLKSTSEELYLQLLAHDLEEIREYVYHYCGSKLKTFFSSVNDGETSVKEHWDNVSLRPTIFLGIPITCKILQEIIQFGYNSENVTIHNNTETILMLIIRGKPILGNDYWVRIMNEISIVFPLLQCHSDSTSKLGQSIFDLFDPDEDIEVVEIVKG